MRLLVLCLVAITHLYGKRLLNNLLQERLLLPIVYQTIADFKVFRII